jgi:hypothetical protein
MKSVVGTFHTAYGPCRFRMYNGFKTDIHFGTEGKPQVTASGIYYEGVLRVCREDLKDPWKIDNTNTIIRRVDEKKIAYGEPYMRFKDGILTEFTQYITRPANAGILTMAVFINLDNEHEELLANLKKAEQKATDAFRLLKDWEAVKSRFFDALSQQVQDLANNDYKAGRFVES